MGDFTVPQNEACVHRDVLEVLGGGKRRSGADTGRHVYAVFVILSVSLEVQSSLCCLRPKPSS